jgi:putative transcriptional regulator
LNKDNYLLLLGKHIASLRIKKKMTQAELAYRCDKDMQSISRLERGKINPSIYFLVEIAEALELPLQKLITF